MDKQEIDTTISVCMLAAGGLKADQIARKLKMAEGEVRRLLKPHKGTLRLKRQGDIY